jgi:hypothetical protein
MFNMLLKRTVLDRISAGEIDVVFRRWKRPTVKTGGTLRTSVGMLDIVVVEVIDAATITDTDACRAGFINAAEVRAELDSRPDGTPYRIEVQPGGADPRDELRRSDDLDAADLAEVRTRLERLDRVSKRGQWTHSVLKLLADNPNVRAQDLAEVVGIDKPTFKNDVRKLKTLGLTISHSPGYELSPRGRTVLAHLDARGRGVRHQSE